MELQDVITKRIAGVEYKISPILTSECLVAYMRFTQLLTTAALGLNKRAAAGSSIDAGMFVAYEFSHAFAIGDFKEGGDLYPMIACVHVVKAGNDVPLKMIFEQHFARKLPDFWTLLKAVGEHNFAGFTAAFGSSLLELIAEAVKSAVTEPVSATAT